MKFIVIKSSRSDICFKDLEGHQVGERVLLELDKRLKTYYEGNPRGVRGLDATGAALEYTNSGGACYWIYQNVDKKAMEAIVEEGESLRFAETSLSEQRGGGFWGREFSVDIQKLKFEEINRVIENSNSYGL